MFYTKKLGHVLVSVVYLISSVVENVHSRMHGGTSSGRGVSRQH